MRSMNENIKIIKLIEFMESPEGWGRNQGRLVYQKLLDFVESNPSASVFRVSLDGVMRVDLSFASETVIELAKRYRTIKGFAFTNLTDLDMLENWDAAAFRKQQPIMIWKEDKGNVIGIAPSQGTFGAFQFALDRPFVRAAEYSSAYPEMSIANASSKFKQLWEQGFLLRREDVSGSGGIEFTYYRIK